jgi:hypothetical protein
MTVTWQNSKPASLPDGFETSLPAIISIVNQSHGRSMCLLDGVIVEPVCTSRSTIDSDFYNTFLHCFAAKIDVWNL